MTTPPKTREEWYDKLLHLSPEYSEDVPRAWAETLDSIMSLQAEVERLTGIVANVRSIVTRANVRVEPEITKFILAEITKAR